MTSAILSKQTDPSFIYKTLPTLNWNSAWSMMLLLLMMFTMEMMMMMMMTNTMAMTKMTSNKAPSWCASQVNAEPLMELQT